MKNNATKTPLFNTLRKALRLAIAANKTHSSSEEMVQRANNERFACIFYEFTS